MKLDRTYVRQAILVRRKRGDKVYEEAVIPLTISVPKEYAGKYFKVIVRLEPIDKEQKQATS